MVGNSTTNDYNGTHIMHRQQQEFCAKIKSAFPGYFEKVRVLDVGSLDINGSNRILFNDSIYTGCDVTEGKNVDIILPAHKLMYPGGDFDTIISTECFEHDMHYEKSIKNIMRMLRVGGLFLFTCATTGRHEHGTLKVNPHDSPGTCNHSLDWGLYYKNLTKDDFMAVEGFDKTFGVKAWAGCEETHDIYFMGIKTAR